MSGRGFVGRRVGQVVSTFVGARPLAAVIAAAALMVAGCGGGDDPRAKAPDKLTIATPNVPPSLDPATGSNEHSDYFNLAYDPLIVEAPDGSFKPGLALSWEYGQRNKSFSMKLRPDVRFSDGEKLDAAAVKTWLEHAMKLEGGRAPDYLGEHSISVTGPLSLTLRFKEPTPLLELVFSQRLEIGMIGSPKAVAADTLASDTAGAGPYMLDEDSTVTGDQYTYVPNPHYWNKPAVHWKQVVIKKFTNPSAALQALKTKQVQVAKDQPAESLDAAKRADLKHVAPLQLLMGLSLLDRDGKMAEPLGDVRVRQAINHAIDREAVANVIGAGSGQPIAQMAVEGDDSHDPELEDAYRFDPDRARQLLADAGYSDGFTLKTLSATIVGQDKLGQALAGQLAKVGIDLELDVKPEVGDYIEQLTAANYPVATLAFGRLPAAVSYQLLYGPDAGIFNPFKSVDSELTSLYGRLRAASAEEAPQIAAQMQGVLVEEAWFAPVVATPLVVLYQAEVTGVVSTPERPVVYTTEIKPTKPTS